MDTMRVKYESHCKASEYLRPWHISVFVIQEICRKVYIFFLLRKGVECILMRNKKNVLILDNGCNNTKIEKLKGV